MCVGEGHFLLCVSLSSPIGSSPSTVAKICCDLTSHFSPCFTECICDLKGEPRSLRVLHKYATTELQAQHCFSYTQPTSLTPSACLAPKASQCGSRAWRMDEGIVMSGNTERKSDCISISGPILSLSLLLCRPPRHSAPFRYTELLFMPWRTQ